MNLRVCNKEEGISEPYISFIKNKKKKKQNCPLEFNKSYYSLVPAKTNVTI